jgi:methionine biosynthesis protein MetW
LALAALSQVMYRRDSMTDLAKPLIYDQIIGASLSPSLKLISELVTPGSRVLDVGCASGYFAAWLAANKGCAVVGNDYSQEAVDVAKQRGVDAYQIDLERERLKSKEFDAVVFADVLEHLRNPEEVLASIEAPRVLISLPNITHWSGRLEVGRGRFPWEDFGLFDRTHLRFFTQENARTLIRGAGFRIAEERFNFEHLPLADKVRGAYRAGMMLAPHLPNLLAYQFIFDARR